MTFNNPSTSFFICLTVSLVILFLSACHLQGRLGNNMDNSVDAQSSMNCSDSGNPRSWIVPKTGQKKKFMAADDGDLRVGNPWPEPRFTENRDGTVTDHLSGLMWTQNANKANGKADWEQAILGAETCTDGGYTDWRLPNRNELQSLIDLGKYNPSLPEGHFFTSVHPSYYWTSTTPANNEDHAWIIHFYIGFVTHDDKGGSHYVWYVRSGHIE